MTRLRAGHAALVRFGEATADAVTAFVGSWTFVFLHALWFGVWILLPVEPFPFGLLTMVVSLEAIFLAGCIMMSENRAQRHDRAENELDLATDLKAEGEIRELKADIAATQAMIAGLRDALGQRHE